MYDMHCHILPYLDDGARDMQQALEMARISVESGVTTMVATPHANQRGRFENYNGAELQVVYEMFLARLAQANIPLRIVPAMEIFASRDVVQCIENGMLCGMGASNRYLIEFPFEAWHADINRILQDMLRNGYMPLVAHPERYRCVKDTPYLVRQWRDMGCMIQLNANSVFGGFGETSRIVARELLAASLVDVVGSDAHGTQHRTPNMKKIADYLVAEHSIAYMRKLLIETPQQILGE